MSLKRNLASISNLRIQVPTTKVTDHENGSSETHCTIPETQESRVGAESKQQPLIKRRSDGRLANIVNDITLSQYCVQLLRDPTVFNFSRLRGRLKSDDRRWMSGFLKLGGLEMLFECLGAFGSYSGTFANLVQRLECVMCIKTVMNSQIGLQSLTGSGIYAERFATGTVVDLFDL